jgi:hypothetical protein
MILQAGQFTMDAQRGLGAGPEVQVGGASLCGALQQSTYFHIKFLFARR